MVLDYKKHCSEITTQTRIDLEFNMISNKNNFILRQVISGKNGNIPKNGGQIIKEFLTQSSCYLTKFNQNNTLRIRKKKRRLNIFNIEVLQIMLHAYDINKKYYTA